MDAAAGLRGGAVVRSAAHSVPFDIRLATPDEFAVLIADFLD
ncbi:hypothetical protein [Streptomyces albicerus]|nr:hypothetical protein [Streptomyces albicerus]